MTGLVTCIVLALAVAILLRLSGARGLMLAVGCAALVAGCLVYRSTATDDIAPVPAAIAAPAKRQSLTEQRHAFTGRFTPGEQWLGMADALASRGNSADAAGVLVAAVKEHPRDYSLWVGLGTMLTDHGGRLNPGARLAFERAIVIAPTYPAPRYFLGLAEARSGNVAEARRLWTGVLAAAPADASWRPMVEDRLAETAPPLAPAD